MNKKSIILISFLILATLASCFWFVKNQEKSNEEIANTKIETTQEEQVLNDEKMKSNWQAYKNEEYGFEFEYPINWALSDHYNEILMEADDKKVEGRYVSFRTLGNVFNVEIGVKNQNESRWMFAHSWYTGTPAGNIFRGDKIKIGDGIAEKQILAYDPINISNYTETKKYTPSESLSTQLVFYCNPTQDKKITSCDDFQIGRNLVAHAEIHYLIHEYPAESQWTDVQEQTEKILRSLNFTD